MIAEKTETRFLGGNSTQWISVSELARKAGVSPSHVSQLVKHDRIPEFRKEGTRTYVPNGRCILPPKNPDSSDKISKFYLKKKEIHSEEIETKVVQMDDLHHEISDLNLEDLGLKVKDLSDNDHVRGIIVFVG